MEACHIGGLDDSGKCEKSWPKFVKLTNVCKLAKHMKANHDDEVILQL